ncbi:minor capsid protein [Schinkia azotoformans]|uniref:minor capsid protein n=1 Tax=Schinkia azotoformans TaxID=1454 RepID=UPI002DB815E4|nr:minor capsid protein [Schinkia azotoformans]MEC1780068.1 minor capsid protein [Schinkia azotoformans]MED4330853.1 minor capsid protein [Schinkia azotoformans]
MLNDDILKMREELDKKAIKDIRPILEAYKRSLDDVRTEIAKIYARYLVDGELSVSKSQRYSILKQLETTLLEQAKQIGYIDVQYTTSILTDVFEESFYQTAYLIDSGVSTVISFAVLRPEMVEAAVMTPIEGKMFSDRIWNNKEILVNRVRESVEKALIQGTDIRKLSRSIKNEFEVSAYESKRLITTEVARVTSQGQKAIFDQSDVVQEVMWDSTLDGKTSKICQSRDGMRWNKNDDYPIPPAHPNCRSAIVPVVSGWTPTKKRENIKNSKGEKATIDYSTYENWRKSKGI